jgi:hypothetical protein
MLRNVSQSLIKCRTNDEVSRLRRHIPSIEIKVIVNPGKKSTCGLVVVTRCIWGEFKNDFVSATSPPFSCNIRWSRNEFPDLDPQGWISLAFRPCHARMPWSDQRDLPRLLIRSPSWIRSHACIFLVEL